jgi:hypothetical protein
MTYDVGSSCPGLRQAQRGGRDSRLNQIMGSPGLRQAQRGGRDSRLNQIMGSLLSNL